MTIDALREKVKGTRGDQHSLFRIALALAVIAMASGADPVPSYQAEVWDNASDDDRTGFLTAASVKRSQALVGEDWVDLPGEVQAALTMAIPQKSSDTDAFFEIASQLESLAKKATAPKTEPLSSQAPPAA